MSYDRWVNLVAAVLLVTLTDSAWGVTPASGHLQLIARTGDVAPGIAGRQFHSFEPPDINDSGQAAFSATLDCCAPLVAVYSTGRGTLELVAIPGMPVEPTGQFAFAGFSDVQIDDAGRTLIGGLMHDLPPEFGAVWVGQNAGNLTPIIMAGQAIDPREPSSNYFQVGTPHLSGGGVLAGRAVSITNGKVAPLSDVLFKSDGNGLAQPVLRAGHQLNFLAPGILIGTYSEPAFDEPMVNDKGQIVVRVSSIDTRRPITEQFGQHLLRIEPNGTYTSVANWLPDDAPFGTLSLPVINNQGGIAFGGEPTAQAALWRKMPGESPRMLVREDDAVPGMPGVFFNHLFFNDDAEMPLWMSDRGDVAFWASLVGEPIGREFAESVWIGSPDNLRPVLVERTPAPGTGGNFSSMTSTLGDLVRDMAVNSNSQVAVLATFEVIPGDQRSGLFATDLAGNLRKIVAYGDMLEVAPGDFRQVNEVGFKGTAHQFQGSGLNDLGQVAFSVYFTDGTAATFISSRVAIPEPAGCITMMTGVVCVVCTNTARWRRKNDREQLLRSGITGH